MANVIGIHEHADMGPDLAALGDHAIAQRRMAAPEQRQRVAHRRGRAVKRDIALAAGEVGEKAGNLNRDHARPARS
ncbi:MAG TPA: hypothetical protein VFV78_10105 [Vicinamibacterales bacterium]|nr:hypothetical protein [Vicinamibacterales bacterium]